MAARQPAMMSPARLLRVVEILKELVRLLSQMPPVRSYHRWLPALAMFGAIHALAATPDPALADTSGCTALIDIVQESLRGEIDVACPASDKVVCEAKNGQIRALLEIIDQRRKRNADECETLAQVNRLLRALPPKS
jgi:hypothetical protein